MAIRPYTGPGFTLSGGVVRNVNGDMEVSPACRFGACASKPNSAPEALALAGATAPGPDTSLDPNRIYAARAAACKQARRNPRQSPKPEAENIFSESAANTIYQSRKTSHA